MSTDAHRGHCQRRALFEPCEPRLLMTAAQPDFFVDYFIDDANTAGQISAGDLSRLSLADAHRMTGMDRVREDYGLTGSGQTVAIIDTGIAYRHSALGGGFGSGYRVVGGWDVPENDGNPYDDGPDGSHGTHVAGIVGSSSASNLGVAPGVDLVALRVFDDAGRGYFNWVESALQWVYNNRNSFRNPITTVNLSLGANWNSTSVPSWSMVEDEFRMLENVGIFISVAAGNSFQSYQTPGLSYPAASSYVVPVMAADDDGSLAYFSQRHSRAIAAPGVSIRSTVPDYVGDGDGSDDDFASYSGTSMAAPYVAGAAVILRQALEQAGRTNINQDMIYEVMRDTADRFYDSATGAYYLRLNMKRAVDSIAPGDEGNTKATAVDLGTLSLRKSYSGSIGYETDSDCFKFTAKRDATVSITVAADEGVSTAWHRIYADGSETTVEGNVISFSVKAGSTYTVRLESLAGTGDYDLAFRLAPKATDLGNLDFALLEKVKVSGEKWYRFEATRAGTLTLQSSIKKGSSDVTLALHNSDLEKVGASSGRYEDRFDTEVQEGETLYVYVSGKNSSVELRFTNLVTTEGSTFNVFGTAIGDRFRFTAGDSLSVAIKGVEYELDREQYDTVNFDGLGGGDRAIITGSDGDDTLHMWPESADMSGPGYALHVSDTETIEANGVAGADLAVLYDSAGNDRATMGRGAASLSGSGFNNSVAAFDEIYANALAGGDDRVDFSSTRASDRMLGESDWALLESSAYESCATGFDRVTANSTKGASLELDPSACDYLFTASGNWT